MAEVSPYGYNVTPFLNVHDQFYGLQTQRIFHHTQENDLLIEQLDQIGKLMASLNNDRKKSQYVDYYQNTEKRALVDAIRAIDSNLIEKGCYAWKEGHIDSLIENLNNKARQIGTFLNPTMMNITDDIQKRNQVTDITGEMVRMYREECSAMVKNQIKRNG